MFLIVIQVYIHFEGRRLILWPFRNDYSSVRFNYHDCTNLTVIIISGGIFW